MPKLPKIVMSLCSTAFLKYLNRSLDPEALDGQNTSTLGILGTLNFRHYYE